MLKLDLGVQVVEPTNPINKRNKENNFLKF